MKKKSRYINFRQLKQQVGISQILEHYELMDGLEGEGDALSGNCCPVCESEANGVFRVSQEKNCWNCFGDCSGGNILDLVSQMEECTIREAAVRIADWSSFECVPAGKKAARKSSKKAAAKKSRKTSRAEESKASESVLHENSAGFPSNKPLGFSLELDNRHPWFDELCLSSETVEEFGLGHCAKGYLKDYIAFPIHNRAGEIVAYGGMSLNEDDPMNPEYRYPEPDKFDPSLELFGLYQALERGQTDVIYLVRTPLQVFQCWHSDGISSVCALSDVSLEALGHNAKELLANCLM